jgi:aminopeptidase N
VSGIEEPVPANDRLTRAEAQERARLLGDVDYAVELDLRPAGPTFSSRTTVRFSCAEPGTSTFIDLDAATLHSATLNGRSVPPDAFADARIVLDGLAAHNELVVDAECAYQRTGVGLHRFTDPVDERVYLHTQFEPFDAHRVYACFDQPDLKAPFRLSVQAPADWVAASNGAVLKQPDAGSEGRWVFEPTPPVSTYITALVAGPYHSVHDRHGDIPLGLYCRQSLAEHLDPDEILGITRQGFDFFAETFDYRYPFSKYDQLFVPEFNAGAMENAGCVTFSEAYVFRAKVTDAARQRRAETILHEMAHMWFGDLATMRWWDDLWLNESFATYMAYLALAEATRFRNAWTEFAYDIKAWAYQQDQLPSTHPIVADMVDTDAVRTNFDGITYAKGASVLKQLVAWVGFEAFIKGLRGYFRRHEWGNAQLADFLAALEESSGRDLDAWSAEWLETAGINTLRAELDAAGETYRAVTMVQEAPETNPTLRAHRLGVGLYDLGQSSLTRRRHVELDIAGERTEIPAVAGERIADLLLPNDADYAYAKIRLDEPSVDTVTEHLSALDDPLARALCWSAVWDMTRDAELPTRRWARLVGAHAASETDVSVQQTLLRQATTALDRYGDPHNRLPERAQLATTAKRALAEAEPGSDRQLIWTRAAAVLADSDEDLAWVRDVLDGNEQLEGLAVDVDLRWHLVGCLATAGRADDALIDAELERDPTDMGRRRAEAARVSQPTPEAKQRAWQLLIDDRDVPLATMRSIVGGMQKAGQEGLLAEYVDRYVDALPDIWGERSPEEALLLTEGLYPDTVVDERVVAAADRALALDLPGPAKRLLAEGRDRTQRALRARAADQE